MEETNLWELIANKCLEKAYKMINSDFETETETVETVSELVDIAIRIDSNLREWEFKQNRTLHINSAITPIK